MLDAHTARLRAPLLRPGKILALAGNYMAHRTEGATGITTPAELLLPEVFCKPVTSIVGHTEAIRLPGPPVVATDYEGELGVVIGKSAWRVSEADSMAHVAGYFPLNDVSGRKLDPGMNRDPAQAARNGYFDWLIGKWPDTFCPIGPWMVTADEVHDPMDLHLVTRVNGQVRQETSTGAMLHSIVRTIAWCSKFMTLEPGDIIATGTPAGVGSARGLFLQAGDVVEVEIGGLGTLRNRVA
jgi:2-keto-4-pentenoate hydratase/2-oxohepta-3-ene-1,7-dioic acid hydratase in catechol pathway